MLVLRLLGALAAIAIGVSFAFYLITRNRRYLTFAWRVIQFTFVVLVASMAFYVIERVVLVL